MHISPVGRICGTCGKLPLFLQFSVYQSPISQKENEEARERRRVPAKYVKSLSRSNSIKSVTIRNDNEIWRDPVLFDEKKYGLELTDALLGLSIEKLSLEVGANSHIKIFLILTCRRKCCGTLLFKKLISETRCKKQQVLCRFVRLIYVGKST